MPIQTEKLDGLPVILATYSQYIAHEDVRQMYLDTEAFLPQLNGRYYHINDIRDSTTSFADFVKIFEYTQQIRKSRTDEAGPLIIFVGVNDWIDNLCRMTKKQTGISIPVFQNLEEARGFIKQDMEKTRH